MANLNQARERSIPPHMSLRDVRAVAGKTLDQVCDEFAEVTGRPITRGAMSAIESGLRRPSAEVLAGLEMVYGVSSGSIVTTYEPRLRGAA